MNNHEKIRSVMGKGSSVCFKMPHKAKKGPLTYEEAWKSIQYCDDKGCPFTEADHHMFNVQQVRHLMGKETYFTYGTLDLNFEQYKKGKVTKDKFGNKIITMVPKK